VFRCRFNLKVKVKIAVTTASTGRTFHAPNIATDLPSTITSPNLSRLIQPIIIELKTIGSPSPPATNKMTDTQPAAKRQKTEAVATRAMTVAGALTEEVDESSKVFTIDEILENVLSNLDLVELTLLERVNSQWKTLIRTAPGLKEQRFLKAMPITSLLTLLEEPDVEKRFWKDEYYQPRLTYDQSALSKDAVVICSVHPCFNRDDTRVRSTGQWMGKCRCIRITLWELEMTRCGDGLRAMYLTQPPCKKADVAIGLGSICALKDRQMTSSEARDDFATLGWICDCLEKIEDILEGAHWGYKMEYQVDIRGHQAATDIDVKMAERFAADPQDYPPVAEKDVDPESEDQASET
jgi:hypothetical protein